jgi:hypothetical protein
MASFNKIQGFVGYLGLAVMNLNTDTLKVALTNSAPSASGSDVLADITQISNGNGYTTGGADTQNTYSEATGTGTLAGVDVVWTASGGSVGAFRYVVLYDDTPSGTPTDPLIGWWDYGSAITLADTETFTVDFGSSILTIA